MFLMFVINSVCNKLFYLTFLDSSLFRHMDEVEADVLYKYLVTNFGPIVMSGTVPFQEDIYQKILDCVRQHPTWTSAHVAANLGYYSCLKFPGIIEYVLIICHSLCQNNVCYLSVPALSNIIGR